jgi:hypothetical protein
MNQNELSPVVARMGTLRTVRKRVMHVQLPRHNLFKKEYSSFIDEIYYRMPVHG